MKKKAEHLHYIATVCAQKSGANFLSCMNIWACGFTIATWWISPCQILKNKAQSKLKTAADQHWTDGALEVGKLNPLSLSIVSVTAERETSFGNLNLEAIPVADWWIQISFICLCSIYVRNHRCSH